MNEVIKIRYAALEQGPAEYGPAELLGDRLARIVDVPVLTKEFWKDDIVELTDLPTDAEPTPSIGRVVYARHETHTLLQFDDELQARILMGIFALLRADTKLVRAPKEGERDILSVAHPGWLDPKAVAAATLGLREADDESDDGDDDSDDSAEATVD
jgi:hypothetical protein